MIFLKFQNGVVTYPYTRAMLQSDNPHTSFPRDLTPIMLIDYGVFQVTETPRPAPSNPVTKNVVELEPTVVQGTWTQRWGEVDASAAEIAERQAVVDDAAITTGIKTDTQLVAFASMTPTQLETWMNANITTQAQAIAQIKRLTRVVHILLRRELRQ